MIKIVIYKEFLEHWTDYPELIERHLKHIDYNCKKAGKQVMKSIPNGGNFSRGGINIIWELE
jgi:hypothetical protein